MGEITVASPVLIYSVILSWGDSEVMMMDRGQWAYLARMPGFNPYSFFEGHPGIFNDHTESGPCFKVSSE